MIRIACHELRLNDSQQWLWEDLPFTGISVETDSEGRLACERAYANGVLDGFVRVWQPQSGQLLAESYYAQGQLHGPHREWHEKLTQTEIARLKSESEYAQGQLLNCQIWDRDGQIRVIPESSTALNERSAENQPLRVKIADLDFTPEYLFEYQGKAFTGIAYELDDQAELSCEVSYCQGMRHGCYREWYHPAQLKLEREYEFGIRTAERSWLSDGQLESETQLQPTDFHYQLLLRRRRRYRF